MITKRFDLSAVCVGLLSLFVASQFGVAAETSEEEAEKIPPWRRLCDAGMAKHRLVSSKDSTKEFKRIENPVLIHQQSIRDDQLGAVYMWIDDNNRPVAIADGVVAPDPERPGTHYFVQEFHSLYGEPIVGILAGRGRWRPSGPGLKWELLPGEIKKPKSTQLMVIQTRSLTRDMKAHGVDWRRENQKQPYRLLSKPLYTYEIRNESNGGSTMGCVFAFCLGTDPEIIYSVESRTDAKGKTNWYQAFAALSDMGLFVKRGDRTVWSESPVRFSGTGPHTSIGEVNLKLPKQ